MRPMTRVARDVLLIAPVVFAGLFPLPARADATKLAYGKHLSQECTTCHRPDGKGQNIPVIFGLEVDYFRTTMNFYRTGARQNPVMNSVAAMLNDEQVDALAIYLATQKPQPSAPPPARRK